MNKLLFRIFLILGIYLLSGYSQLFAHANQDYARYETIKLLERSEYAQIGNLQINRNLPVRSAKMHAQEELKKIQATDSEAEEDEYLAFKKPAECSKFFLSAPYATIPGLLFRNLNKILSRQKLLASCPSLGLYLRFCIIRI